MPILKSESMRYSILTVVLFSGLILSAQAPSSTISVEDYIIDSETELDSDAAELIEAHILPLSLIYNFEYTVGDAVKLSFIEVSEQEAYDIEMFLQIDGDVFKMQFEGDGTVRDETGNILSNNTNALDVFYFKLQANAIAYCKNDEIIQSKTVNPSTVTAFYQNNHSPLATTVPSTTAIFEVEYVQTPNYSMNGDIAGSILFPIDDCTANETYAYVPDVEIEVMQINGETNSAVVSDTYGRFLVQGFPSGLISMTPTYNAANIHPIGLGINQNDVDIISAHVAGSTPILCPLKRLAADVNQDGLIDQTDINIVKDHLSTLDQSIIAKNWWFVARPYVYPTDYHPDIHFVNQFWDFRSTNAQGDILPLSAMLRYNDKAYTYKAFSSNTPIDPLSTQSWMNKLHEWMFDANPSCNEVFWGFYMVRPGDVDGSSATELGWAVQN